MGAIVALCLLASIVGPPSHAQQLRGDPISCVVPVSTATTIQAVGGACAARPGLRLWVTDVLFSASAVGTGADTFPTLKYGTGTTCGTGTAVFWGSLTVSGIAVPQAFQTPMALPVNVDVCWISSTAGAKLIVITGYYTP